MNAIWDFDGTELLCYSNDRIPYALGKALEAKRMERLDNMCRMLDGTNPFPPLDMVGELRMDWHYASI